MTPLIDTIEEIVNGQDFTGLTFGENPLTEVNYQPGHPREIINSMVQMSQSPTYKDKKFPLIGLFLDVPFDDSYEGYKLDDFTIVIAVDTDPTFSTEDRKEVNFKPLLRPIYEILKKAIYNSSALSCPMPFVPKVREWYFYGKDGIYGVEGNVFNDYIDAIEVTFRGITLINKCKK